MALDLPSYLLGKSKGGGGGGTSDYSQLSNKPSINGITLSGNKTSVDLGLQNTTQYSTMPTASSENVGQIVQYIGTTDANYTNGYFYICVSDNSSYSWNNLNVQGSAGTPLYIVTDNTTSADNKAVFLEIFNKLKDNDYNFNVVLFVSDTFYYPYKIYKTSYSVRLHFMKMLKPDYQTLGNNVLSGTITEINLEYYKNSNNISKEEATNIFASKYYVDSLVGDISTVLATLTTPGGE